MSMAFERTCLHVWLAMLQVAKFFKDGANGNGCFAAVEEGAKFGLSRRRHDIFEDVGDG